jgi:hypothetical protein
MLFISGCVTVKPKNLTRRSINIAGTTLNSNPETRNPDHHLSRVMLYKATLDIRKHHLTGLLILKRMDSIGSSGNYSASSGKIYRIVFSNEIGMTFFDLEMKQDSFKVVSSFESLNKKALIKIFETDFRMLTGMDSLKIKSQYTQTGTQNLVLSGKAGKYKTWQTYSPTGDTLYATAGKSTIADPVIISYQKYEGGIPAKIVVENPFIGMKLSLRLLNRNN